ncbi:hypothetical protein ACJIZ3_018091 [Penstemon smallii]|uniref:Uncharacterized protein n=1 Tax=Penstemon smallii TaxID=265156 RepID=A0ABD3SXE1_9LAMI
MSRLVRTLNRNADIIGLILTKLSELSTKLSKVKSCNLLIQMLRQHVNLLLILPTRSFIPKLELCNNLISKRTRHHKARVASGTTQVHQTTLCQHNNARFCVREYPSTVHVDFIVKVTNVADNCVNLETFHESLKGTNGIDFGYDYTGTSLFQSNGTTLSYVSIATYDTNLSGNHHICGPHQSIGQVIDINSREKQRAIILHLIQPLHTCSGLFRNTNQSLLHLGIPLRINLQGFPNQTKHNMKLSIIGRIRIRNRARFLILLLSLHTLMNQQCSITTIIHNQIWPTVGTPIQSPLSAPPVLGQRFTFPGKDGGAVAGNGGGGVVLGGEDVAGTPTNLGTQGGEGFDKDGGLDGHVETSSDSGTFEGLRWTEFGPAGHEAGHFDFGEFDFETAEVGLGHVTDLVLTAGGGFLDQESHWKLKNSIFFISNLRRLRFWWIGCESKSQVEERDVVVLVVNGGGKEFIKIAFWLLYLNIFLFHLSHGSESTILLVYQIGPSPSRSRCTWSYSSSHGGVGVGGTSIDVYKLQLTRHLCTNLG